MKKTVERRAADIADLLMRAGVCGSNPPHMLLVFSLAQNSMDPAFMERWERGPWGFFGTGRHKDLSAFDVQVNEITYRYVKNRGQVEKVRLGDITQHTRRGTVLPGTAR